MIKPENLVTLVSYQKDAVISRTIIKEKAGTVTLFAFDKSQALSEHTVDFDALVLLLDGEAEIKIAGEANVLKSGDYVIMPANKSHSVKALTNFKMLLIMIKKIKEDKCTGTK